MKKIHYSNIYKKPNEEELETSREQTYLFISAIQERDLSLLESLLYEKFTYFGNKTKWQTLDYFKEQFEKQIPEEYQTQDVWMYFCKVCQPGNPALFFNCGYWPVVEDEENTPKSLMLSFKEGLISDLTLCYEYCNAEQLQEITIRN